MQKDDYYNKKNDQGKTDWSLLPWKAIESAARIMTIAIAPKEQGGEGYGLASWRDVPEGYYRYWAAMIRHIVRRFVYNEVIDQKSGEPHMGHVICNAAFVFQKDLEEKESGGNIDTNFYCRQQKKEKVVEQKEEDLNNAAKILDEYIHRKGYEYSENHIPHDRDFQTTYEDSIRQMEFVFDYAKPPVKEKETYCTKCGITYKNYLKDTLPPECFHVWDTK